MSFSVGWSKGSRLAGETVSENQSPALGSDRSGSTALLNSVAILPFNRAPAGELNIHIDPSVSTKKLSGLIDGFFSIGGCISVSLL